MQKWLNSRRKTWPIIYVCLCVCQCGKIITAELFNIRSQNLVPGLTLMKSWTSLMVKVIGHGHPVENVFF